MNDFCRASYNWGGGGGGGGGGGKLHLSLGCPPDKLNSLAYF